MQQDLAIAASCDPSPWYHGYSCYFPGTMFNIPKPNSVSNPDFRFVSEVQLPSSSPPVLRVMVGYAFVFVYNYSAPSTFPLILFQNQELLTHFLISYPRKTFALREFAIQNQSHSIYRNIFFLSIHENISSKFYLIAISTMPNVDTSDLNIVLGVLGIEYSPYIHVLTFLTQSRHIHGFLWHGFGKNQVCLVLGRSTQVNPRLAPHKTVSNLP